MTTNSPNPVDGDVLKELRNRYAEPKIPSCSICGGELSVQRSGGGSPTIWACSGMIDDPTGERTWVYAEGRSCADEHYERSRWTDYRRGGDSDVIDLIDAYQALLDERLNATAQPFRGNPDSTTESFRDIEETTTNAQPVSDGCKVPDGWKLVPVDATRAMIDAAQRVEEDGYDAMHKAMLAAAPGGQ